MDEVSKQAVLSCLLFILVAVLALFLDTWYRRHRSNVDGWKRINIGIVSVLLIAIGTTIAQMCFFGRTELECRILNHISGSLWNTSEPFVRILFIARLIEVNKMPQKLDRCVDYGLVVITFLYWIVAVVLLNVTMGYAVINDLCIGIVDPAAGAFTFMFPQIIDVVMNVRLWQVLMKIKSRNAPNLLMTTTFVFFLASSIISLLSLLIIAQVIPLDKSLFTTWLTFQQAFDVCSIALPTIIVRFARTQRPVSPLQPTK
ncbi:THH1/TOM1/TOM3 domain-containing protein [Plasmodiophora brassicae]